MTETDILDRHEQVQAIRLLSKWYSRCEQRFRIEMVCGYPDVYQDAERLDETKLFLEGVVQRLDRMRKNHSNEDGDEHPGYKWIPGDPVWPPEEKHEQE